MYISEPVTTTSLYIDSDSTQNKYKGLLNANFQDYMDGIVQSSQLEIKAGKLKNSVTGLGAGLGTAFGSLGGPIGLAFGFTIGQTIGKYLGSVIGEKKYGQAISDMSDVTHFAKMRHTMLATSYMFQKKMDEGIDNFRQNENKRIKDAISEMST